MLRRRGDARLFNGRPPGAERGSSRPIACARTGAPFALVTGIADGRRRRTRALLVTADDARGTLGTGALDSGGHRAGPRRGSPALRRVRRWFASRTTIDGAAAGAGRAAGPVPDPAVRQRPRRPRARRRARRLPRAGALDRFARAADFPRPGPAKRRDRRHGRTGRRIAACAGRRVRRRDHAQPCARLDADRGGARARRLALCRTDRIAIEARPVRAAPRRARPSRRRVRAGAVPDRRRRASPIRGKHPGAIAIAIAAELLVVREASATVCRRCAWRRG